MSVDICEKDYVWNPATCSCKNGKYLTNIIDDSVITRDQIIDAVPMSYDEETKTILTNFNENIGTCKIQYFYILLTFLLIANVLLIAV